MATGSIESTVRHLRTREQQEYLAIRPPTRHRIPPLSAAATRSNLQERASALSIIRSLALLLAVSSTIMSKRYNIGVIGYGLSAKVFHIPLVTVVPEFKLYAIVQRSPTADNDATKDHPGVKACRTVDELFADKEVDVVVVTTHPATHHELTTRALQAGKHVIVEKPFTVNVAEAEDLCRVSKECGKWVCVYQNRRWDGDFATVGKLVHGGALGRVSEFETHFDRHRPEVQTGSWKMDEVGGGVVWDLGSHLLDQVGFVIVWG